MESRDFMSMLVSKALQFACDIDRYDPDQDDRGFVGGRFAGGGGDRGGVLGVHGVCGGHSDRRAGEPEGGGGVCGRRAQGRGGDVGVCEQDERRVLAGDGVPRALPRAPLPRAQGRRRRRGRREKVLAGGRAHAGGVWRRRREAVCGGQRPARAVPAAQGGGEAERDAGGQGERRRDHFLGRGRVPWGGPRVEPLRGAVRAAAVLRGAWGRGGAAADSVGEID
mmetsp:Transcript_28274/g.57386  ORF Transcript_28274/g.57386 Transcript_28274/m.57386 type:complete len:223 (-) Transcript_28274:121-789(-)